MSNFHIIYGVTDTIGVFLKFLKSWKIKLFEVYNETTGFIILQILPGKH